MHALIPPLALLLERVVGYSPALVARIGHPVMWFGAVIAWLEKRLNRRDWSLAQRRAAGVFAMLVVLVIVGVFTVGLQMGLRALPGGIVLEIVLATPFLAQKELGRAVEAVATGLRRSLAAGREAVSHVVGRDPQQLDEAGVARAAVETLAESTSDGVVAPWFWLLVAGLPGVALYKAINTADSMIGHLNDRYRDYGWAGARLDDLVNLVPARLTALLVMVACFFVDGASPSGAWRAALRDAGKHRSPNSGWPEAAFGGALSFALGGPRSYEGEVVDLPVMGEGRAALGPGDIAVAVGLYRVVLNVLLVGSGVLGILIWIGGA